MKCPECDKQSYTFKPEGTVKEGITYQYKCDNCRTYWNPARSEWLKVIRETC